MTGAVRVFALVTLTMGAFAANSLLNRAAIAGGHIDVASFGMIRLLAGACALYGICRVFRGGVHFSRPAQVTGVISLLVYLFGFSAAYAVLDAGIGALILFAMVQVAMFAAAVIAREQLPARRWIGAGLALAGLVFLLWPATAAPVSQPHAAMMAVAGLAWGVYSLTGRRATDALQATAANFVISVPVGAAIFALWLALDPALPGTIAPQGILLAIISGAITSGLGYALWYAVLPNLTSTSAAVAQLSVPVIALLAGAIFLAEAIDPRSGIATVVILSGIALSLLPIPRRRHGK